MSEAKQLAPDIYFACERGWHISALVIQLAHEHGWAKGELAYDPLVDPDYARAIGVLGRDGVEALEGFINLVDPEMLQWMEDAATEYIQDNLIPEGHWCGYSEGFGDWGVWEEERDE